MKRTLTIVTLTLGLALLMAGVASADWIAHERRTYVGDNHCVRVRSEISHGSGGGYSKATVRAKKNTPYECAGREKRSRNNLKAKWKLLYQTWNGWETCRYSNYVFNTQRVDTFSVYRDHGTSVRCGNTKYITVARGGVNFGSGFEGEKDVYSSPGHVLP